MECLHPVITPTGVFACGRCTACLSSRKNSWVTRLQQEYRCSINSIFFTLTYNDMHTPRMNALSVTSKTDIQNFMKRLRKLLKITGLRYFIISEYGPKTLRPHYHGILFNLPTDLSKINLDVHFPTPRNKIEWLYGITKCIERAWQKNGEPMGFVTVDEVTGPRINYVAKYCLAFRLLPHSYRTKEARPFLLSSRKPGIGAGYITDDIITSHLATGRHHLHYAGTKRSLPRYYSDRIFITEESREEWRQQVAYMREKKVLDYLEKYGDYDYKLLLNGVNSTMKEQQYQHFVDTVYTKLKKSGKI